MVIGVLLNSGGMGVGSGVRFYVSFVFLLIRYVRLKVSSSLFVWLCVCIWCSSVCL